MKVKICGLQTIEHVNAAASAGADYLGFVFAKSRRQVTSQQVKKITLDVPQHVKKVGVFVSPTKQEVEQIIASANLDLVQIHGIKPDAHFSVPVIYVYTVAGYQRKTEMLRGTPEYILFDAPPREFVGGNGQTFDWSKLHLSDEERQKSFIAGGLTSQNVQMVKHLFKPYAVDVSSGVESNGIKDSKKIYTFIKKAKEELDV